MIKRLKNPTSYFLFLAVAAGSLFSVEQTVADETTALSRMAIYMNPVKNCTDLTISKDRLSVLSSRRFFTMPARSMLPTIHPGDYVLSISPTEKNPPRPGDLIVFNVRGNVKVQYTKRLIGTAGDKIVIKDGKIAINGKALHRTYKGRFLDKRDRSQVEFKIFNETLSNGAQYLVMKRAGSVPYSPSGVYDVPASSLFVLGDNRDNSMDSRFAQIGFVSNAHVVGIIACIAHKER